MVAQGVRREREETAGPPDVAARGRGRVAAGRGRAVAALVLLAACGFALRAWSLGDVGFAEDEINKLEAARSYARGRITANAEHPMLMKTLVFVSVEAAEAWNAAVPAWVQRRVGAWRGVSWADAARVGDEAAVRFPNVVFGSLTVAPLFLLTAALFDRRTALLAAAFWATGVGAITFNRVAKEDTLLVFFMLFAFYFYVRAKQASGFEIRGKRRNYLLSGASFGLMLASKYFPHFLGLNMLYHHFARLRVREPGEPRGRTPLLFYAAVVIAFLAANPSVLLPETWAYLSAYSGERLLTHHGYLMGETLYDNVMSKTPFGGTPVYFYLLYLAIKTPLPVLLAFGAGLFVVARRRREPGPLFLLLMVGLWVVPYSLAGAKWLRYTLSLIPFFYMTAAVGVTALARLASGSFVGGGAARGAAVWAALVALFVALPAWAAARSAPHYALYTNALVAGRAGHYFPHDEFYDAGLREALHFVAERAPRGATVAHETPGVAGHYLEKFGRGDLGSRVVSDPDFDVRTAPGPVYVIRQRGRTYFENREELDFVRAGGGGFALVHEVSVGGASAAQVYCRES